MAVIWDEYTSRLEGATATDTQLLQQVARGAIIDIGCGIGKHLAMCDLGTIKVGVDAGFPGLQRGKTAVPELNLVCGSIYQLPVRSSTFDVAIMVDVIEHLDEPLTALHEVVRVLQPSGVLMVQTPNYPIKRLYDHWHYVRGSRARVRDDPTHVSKLNFAQLVSLVTRAGFTISRIVARNIVLDKYLKGLRRLRRTKLGQFLGQKVIVVARKAY